MAGSTRVAALLGGVCLVAVSAPVSAQLSPPGNNNPAVAPVDNQADAPPGATSGNNNAAAAVTPNSAAAAVPATAVEAPLTPATASEDPTPGDIVVTGSRLARTTFSTPTPVTAISEKQLEAKAAPTVFDLLRDVPQLRPNRSNGSATDVGGSTFNMRSLGFQRTLVLINGQRTMNSSPTGGFDLNILPAPLINRLEIVTGGASSVYGSDAVTGVVNVFLNGTLSGVRGDVQYNITSYGDNRTLSASAAYGADFAGDRGHIVIAGSYYDRPDILYQGARPFGRTGAVLVPNASYTATNGQPRQLIATGNVLSSMTAGGIITTAGSLRNITFGRSGAQGFQQPGANFGTVYMIGGGGPFTQPDYGVLVSASERTNGYGRASFDLSDDLEVYADLLYARGKQRQTNVPNFNNGDIVIRRDNAFLPANILAQMVANNLQTINLGRLNLEMGVNDNTTRNDYIRTSAGLRGKLIENWTWDGGIIYTRAKYYNFALHNRINANWIAALDTVRNPATGGVAGVAIGAPVCRSTLTNPTNGCVAANPFGENSISQAVVNYVTGTSFIRAFSHSTNLVLNTRGTLFDTWAGPVAAAFGVEYRRDDVNFTSDPISAVAGWRQASSAPYRGKLNVKEGYAELGVPLARDTWFAKNLEVDLAGRYVDYSTTGSTGVWKVGLNWSVTDEIRLRSSYSRDFRAPTINELFAAPTVREGTVVTDRTNNPNNVTTVVRTRSGGSTALQPEVAHTLTGGIVLRPSFISDLQFSVDFFDIKLDGAITAVQSQEVIDRCARGENTFCGAIVRNAAGTITEVGIPFFNAQTLKTRGLDFELSYRIPIGEGSVTLSSVASYTDRLITISNAVPTDTAGQLQGTYATPKWRGATTATYQKGRLLLRALVNYLGKGKYDNTFTDRDLQPNRFAAVAYVDISGEYAVTENVQFYAKIENLLNRQPPLIAENTAIRAGAANASNFYDLIGRNFGVGIRVKF